jgi:hypothetical protein
MQLFAFHEHNSGYVDKGNVKFANIRFQYVLFAYNKILVTAANHAMSKKLKLTQRLEELCVVAIIQARHEILQVWYFGNDLENFGSVQHLKSFS